MGRKSDEVDNPIVVAVVNTNPDLVRLLRVALEHAGFVVLVMHIEDIKLGATDMDMLLNQHDPKVIVYDVAPPYDQNWRFLDHLRASTSFRGRQFVQLGKREANAGAGAQGRAGLRGRRQVEGHR